MGMITKFYIDEAGNYIGGFSEGNESIPPGAIEIDSPPAHGWQKYDLNNAVWLPLTDEQLAMINGGTNV